MFTKFYEILIVIIMFIHMFINKLMFICPF